MKILLDGLQNSPVNYTYTGYWFMRAVTHGGLGRLPGDAATEDLAENEAKRLEVSLSMPFDRAVENMIRSGHAPDFSVEYMLALLTGGETDASALELVRRKTYFDQGGQAAVEPEVIPTDRFFRNAWRRNGDGVFVEVDAARTIFADKVLAAVAGLQKRVEQDEKRVLLLGASPEFDARLDALAAIDLRSLGQQLGVAQTPEEIRSLWPMELPALGG